MKPKDASCAAAPKRRARAAETGRRLGALLAFVGIVVGTPDARSDVPGDVVMIVNAANSSAAMTSDEVKNYYLGEKTAWPGGAQVVLFARSGESGAGATFFRDVLHMAPARFRRHWQERAFAGKPGKPPEDIEDSAALEKRIASAPGAIGFVASSEARSLPSGVKTIAVK